MRNKEEIKDQYRLLGLAINWRGPDEHNQLKCIRRHLDAIRELSEPEGLAMSVLRLTDLCNRLEEELDVAIRSNVWLRERLTFRDQSLRACRAAEEVLKEQYDKLELIIAASQPYTEKLRKDLAR